MMGKKEYIRREDIETMSRPMESQPGPFQTQYEREFQAPLESPDICFHEFTRKFVNQGVAAR